ncbi:hypothetical protein ACRAWB_08885 [Leifsonia poae]|uniref:hypothetical protein n=1 Tax=Leifsonia poae TaxID=110933 RepID=UPI003D68E493
MTAFSNLIERLVYTAHVEHGLEYSLEGIGDPELRLKLSGPKGDSLVLSWFEEQGANHVDWLLESERSGRVSHSEGRYPRDKPTRLVIDFVTEAAPKPKAASIRPKGKLVSRVFGWTLLFAVFVSIRVIAISIPPSFWEPSRQNTRVNDGGRMFETAQQLTNFILPTDLPRVVLGTLVNQPALGFTLIALTTLMFMQISMPWLSLSIDTVHWRGVGMLAVLGMGVCGAVTTAPFPWNIALSGLFAAQLWTACYGWTIDWQLRRWLVLSREAQFARNALSVASLEMGHYATLHDLAHHVNANATRAQRAIWKSRERALRKPKVEQAFFEARLAASLLRRELRAIRRATSTSAADFRRWARRDERMFRLRKWLDSVLPLLVVGAVLFIALAPTPWIGPTCLAQGKNEMTVFVISESPAAYLTDASRTLVTPGQWDGFSRKPGSCATK